MKTEKLLAELHLELAKWYKFTQDNDVLNYQYADMSKCSYAEGIIFAINLLKNNK